MKNLCLLLLFLSLFGCKAREDSGDWSEEVVISGRVLNREVYPKEKEVTFVVPYLSRMETVCAVPIADDGTFSFRFRPYAPVREVGLRNYAEHLFVRPGDSLFVEVVSSAFSRWPFSLWAVIIVVLIVAIPEVLPMNLRGNWKRSVLNVGNVVPTSYRNMRRVPR